jgi:hypothetical protein
MSKAASFRLHTPFAGVGRDRPDGGVREYARRLSAEPDPAENYALYSDTG